MKHMVKHISHIFLDNYQIYVPLKLLKKIEFAIYLGPFYL